MNLVKNNTLSQSKLHSIWQYCCIINNKSASISEKYFRPGGMPWSKWTLSIRSIRDTLVADDPAPGLNTTPRIAYRHPIAVSPVLLALSVSNF
jgi:hypothetical protein